MKNIFLIIILSFFAISSNADDSTSTKALIIQRLIKVQNEGVTQASILSMVALGYQVSDISYRKDANSCLIRLKMIGSGLEDNTDVFSFYKDELASGSDSYKWLYEVCKSRAN